MRPRTPNDPKRSALQRTTQSREDHRRRLARLHRNPEKELVCRDCGNVSEVFHGWSFCGSHCDGDQSVQLAAYHDWEIREKSEPPKS